MADKQFAAPSGGYRANVSLGGPKLRAVLALITVARAV